MPARLHCRHTRVAVLGALVPGADDVVLPGADPVDATEDAVEVGGAPLVAALASADAAADVDVAAGATPAKPRRLAVDVGAPPLPNAAPDVAI